MTQVFSFDPKIYVWLCLLLWAPAQLQAQASAGEDDHADPVELRAARFLFSEGNQLTDQSEHARALQAFALSHELHRAASTAVNIVGLLIDLEDYSSARAWSAYAHGLPDLNARAREILTDFDRTIAEHQGTLRLEIAEPRKFKITVEDQLADADVITRGMSLAPGRYYLEVAQQGMVTFGANVVVQEGQQTEVAYKEHAIGRRQPSTAKPARFTPPDANGARASVDASRELSPPPSAPTRDSVVDEPWFRAIVATAATMTILSTALVIHEL